MKITEGQNIQNKFLLSRSLLLGGGVSLILSSGGRDAWIGVILGFILGIIIIYFYSKISGSIKGPLQNYLKEKTPLNLLIKFVLVSYLLFFIFLLLIIFSTFIYSYYLPFTKAIFSSLPFLFLAIFLSTKGDNAIARVGQILFWISITLVIIKIIATFSYIEVKNYLPIFTISSKNLFLTAINYATLTTTPYLVLIDTKTSFKTNLKSYILSFIPTFLMIAYLIGCFGSNLVRTFSYPEFTILRLINFFNFIQNIESFLAINWLFDIFMALSYSSLKLKNVINYKKNYITYIILFILLYIVSNCVISDYRITITFYQVFSFVFLMLNILVLGLLGIKKGFSSKST